MFGSNLLRYWKGMDNLWGWGTCMIVPLRPMLLPPGNQPGVWGADYYLPSETSSAQRFSAFSEMANNYMT